MARTNTRYFDSLDEAIKVAKKRAQSTYITQYIYRNEDKLCIRNILIESEKPITKVKFDGSVQRSLHYD
jgi:hypothetical protein